jgi:hypothetical protein
MPLAPSNAGVLIFYCHEPLVSSCPILDGEASYYLLGESPLRKMIDDTVVLPINQS